MKLVTYRENGSTRAGLVRGTKVYPLAAKSVDDFLASADQTLPEDWETEGGLDLNGLDLAPVLTRPNKMLCVGHNFAEHIREMGRELPEYPTLFAKFPSSLIGANDDITLPAVSNAVDWEVEVAVVIGKDVKNVSVEEARGAIAGFTLFNDVTCRDWQHRTSQWLQGKNFDSTSPLGPMFVSSDELDWATGLELSCYVNDELVQSASTADLVFTPEIAISYLSKVMTLNVGDVIALGTPGGVGAAFTPPRFLKPGDVLTTKIEGLGEARNLCVGTVASH